MKSSTVPVTFGWAAALSCAAALSGEPYEYAIFDLGNLGEPNSAARAINGHGQVTGESDDGENLRAFLWADPGPMNDLGALPGGNGRSKGWGVNDLGWVAGAAYDANLDPHPVLWRDGQIIDLSGGIPGLGGWAEDLNNAGQVTGIWGKDTGDGVVHVGFLWEDGVMTQLPGLGGPDAWSNSHAINEQGHATGFCDSADGMTAIAVLWRDGGIVQLGALYSDYPAYGHDVNDLDQVVGRGLPFGFDTDAHAFFWSDGIMTDIHGLGRDSYAYGLNNAGEVVGFATFSDDLFDWAGFRWTLEDGMVDLNRLIPPHTGREILWAEDVNDAGQIAANGAPPGQIWRIGEAYLLTPVHPSLTLEAAGGNLVAGRVNELVVTGATPGARVHFAYSETGGGAAIPGCSLQENALQLHEPLVIGHARADGDGEARLRRFLPRPARGRTVLVQAVVVQECAVSGLMVETVQ